MAISDYSSDGYVWVVNGRRITHWGETDPPVTDRQLSSRATLRQGQGRRALKLGHPNPGREVVMNLSPGSPDSAFMQALSNSNATIEVQGTQIGTLEVKSGVEGVIIDNGQSGRGGATTVSDDTYTIHFNIWTDLRGGD